MADIETLPVKRGRGRPPTIVVNPVIRQQLIDIISKGNYVSTACVALGLTEDFYWNCEEQARRGQPQYVEFVKELKKAEANAEIEITADMRKGKEHFLPAATMLERRFRDRWGRSDRHQIDANVSIRVEQVNYASLAKQIRPNKVKQGK